MKKRRLKVEDHETVLHMFELGHSKTRIADSLNVPWASVSSVVSEKYPEFVGRRYLPVKDIVKAYAAGETMESIADEHNTTIATVKNRLEGAGVEIRSQSESNRKHLFNEGYFKDIDTAEKAYWLGFIFADGNVSSRLCDVAITLSNGDREHLEKFLVAIGHTGKLPVYLVRGPLRGTSFSKVSLRSHSMPLDLIAHGCLPNKSLDCGPPIGVPDEFIFDFIRGVVDGDGYVSKAGFPSIEIVGSYRLMEWIAERLEMPQPRPHKTIWRVRANGSHATAIMKTLYENAPVYLDRKMERARRNYE